MEKNLKVTGSEIKDFIQNFLGYAQVEECDIFRSDLRLDDASIEGLVAACNAKFEANAKVERLQTVKQLIKRVKSTAKANLT